MTTRNPLIEHPNVRVSGHAVLQVLSQHADATKGSAQRSDDTYLADGPNGRPVVLKPLDADCLLPNGLHPTIRDRLSRVRELAVPGVANLYGVDRDEQNRDKAWLIWEFLEGQNLATVAKSSVTETSLAGLLESLVLRTEAMHRHGIVHGQISPTNAIVSGDGRLRLTDVSPLLYNDPSDDVWGVCDTIRQCIGDSQARPAIQSLLDDLSLPGDEAAPAAVLRRLALRLGEIAQGRAGPSPTSPSQNPARQAVRRRAVVWALAVVLLGGCAAVALWHWLPT